MVDNGKELERIISEGLFTREDDNGNKGSDKQEAGEEKEERKSRRKRSTKEARQRDNSEGSEGTTEGREKSEEQSEELSGLASVDDKPEQIFLEVDKKSKKKSVKKGRDKVKEEIKLILVAVYSAVGALVDECFHLTPQESEILADAIVRYLEEHKLLETVKEKSSLINLIIAFASVNTPKLLTYYAKLQKKEGGTKNDKSREATNNTEPSTGTVSRTEPDAGDVKTNLVKYYS